MDDANHDLSSDDRRWAEAIAIVAQCSIPEAEKRIRRIRYDPRLEAHLRDLSKQLGSNVVVTNVEWSGPEMKDITASVVPRPVVPTSTMSPTDLFRSQLQAQAVMRAEVATFELERLFKHRSLVDLRALALGLGRELWEASSKAAVRAGTR